MMNPTPSQPLPQGFPPSPAVYSGQPVPSQLVSQPLSQPLHYATPPSTPVGSGPPPYAPLYAGPPRSFAALRVAVLVLAILGFITILPVTLPASVVGARANAYPLPSITLGQISGDTRVGQSITFTVTRNAGTDLQYLWDFGDQSSGTGAEVSHTYQDSGDFEVQVTATDPIGQSATGSLHVTILPPKPTASFTYSAEPASPLTIDFDASNSTGEQFQSSWDFGDGNQGSGTTTSHTYSQVGTYTVTLTVTDVASQTATQQEQVQVSVPPPQAAFTATSTGVDCVDLDASASTGYQLTYNWAFGDGQTSDGNFSSFYSYCYASAGTYSVTLTVVDGTGQKATSKHSVTVS